ncbi:MAG: sugar phosphate isomerase/epimerase [Eubacterium sp.]|nr:sugar phosphate isomerase/epimerase [Eubacterium sp.]
MKFGCSLEMVNVLTSGPCAFTKQSKKFWIDYFKYIAAAGFQGIELPFNCFNSDAMAFETGRSGIPCNALAVASKYGSPEQFLELLKEFGIEEVTSVHVNANDAMLELAATESPAGEYYGLLEKLCMESLEHAHSLRAGGLVVSPTPELGWVLNYFKDSMDEFEEKTIACMKKLVQAGKEKGVCVAIKNDFWSCFAGEKTKELLEQVKEASFAPDLAHLYISKQPVVETLQSCSDRLAYVRMSDTSFEDAVGNYKRINAELPVSGSQKVFCDCGEGSVDIMGAMQCLKENGYDGWVICENKKTLDVYRGLLKLGWFVNHKLAKNLK